MFLFMLRSLIRTRLSVAGYSPPEFSYAVAEQSFFGFLKGFLNHF